jgi:hypothetical protein
MRAHYDFSKMKERRNPYVRFLKQTITIRLEKDTVNYFKDLSPRVGMPYQNLINLYLRDCAVHHVTPRFIWTGRGSATHFGGPVRHRPKQSPRRRTILSIASPPPFG